MRLSEETFNSLIAGLYEVGFGRKDWVEAIGSVATAFGGAGSVVFDLNPGSGQISNWTGPGLESGADEYAQYANAINPRMHFALQAPAGHLVWDYRVLAEEQIRRHEFYEWTMLHGGVKYFIGTRLFDDLESNTSTFASVEFTPAHGHVSRGEIETFERLQSHIANAWRMNRLMHRRRASERIAALMESHAGCGLIVFDSSGRIRSVNDHAAGILRQRDGLMIRDGALVARLANETRRLKALLQACWRTSLDGLGSAGGALAVTRAAALYRPRHARRRPAGTVSRRPAGHPRHGYRSRPADHGAA